MKNRIHRYQEYNRYRMIRAINFDEKKAALLFKIIPFLLHANYPDLPGYVENPQCPYGIYGLRPRKLVDSELFSRYFPYSKALHKDTADPFTEQPVIQSLKTIGSIGTIAQTGKSDCDFWVSIRQNEIGLPGKALLEQKCKAIEQWIDKKGVEVHFFLMDIDQTRENSFDSAAEEESAGSALKILLKDELFRTHILVAGKMLLWWLLPPGLSEEGYLAYADKLFSKKIINPSHFVDLGYMTDIPKSEVFGASLWQLNKAYDSPYKAVIKFAYLDMLLQDKSQALPLFSDKVKCLVTFPEKMKEVTNSKIAITDVDPYLLLSREIIAFYQKRTKEKQRGQLIRDCLFLKTLEGMESARRQHLRAITDLMEHWNLLPENSSQFSVLSDWKFKDLMQLGARIHDFLLETYNHLQADFSIYSQNTTLAITQRDIAVLGRKLFTFYEKKPFKIDYIQSISPEAIGQNDITIHVAQVDGRDTFYAFQGNQTRTNLSTLADFLIKKDSAMPSLMTWLFINGILHSKTNLHLTKNYMPVDLVDLQNLMETMFNNFPLVHFSHIPAENLVKEETIVRGLIIVNMYKEPIRESKSLRSWLISYNSYGEYFVEEFNTLIQLKNKIHTLLTGHFVSRWNNNLDFFIPQQKERHLLREMIFN